MESNWIWHKKLKKKWHKQRWLLKKKDKSQEKKKKKLDEGGLFWNLILKPHPLKNTASAESLYSSVARPVKMRENDAVFPLKK